LEIPRAVSYARARRL